MLLSSYFVVPILIPVVRFLYEAISDNNYDRKVEIQNAQSTKKKQ